MKKYEVGAKNDIKTENIITILRICLGWNQHKIQGQMKILRLEMLIVGDNKKRNCGRQNVLIESMT